MHRRQAVKLVTAAGLSRLVSQCAAAHVSHPVSHNQPVSHLVVQPVSQKRSLLDAPSPKFQLFEYVSHDYTVEDDLDLDDNGKTFRVFGVIIGMVFNPESCYKRGWLYYVTTYQPESLDQPWSVDSYWHESEIIPQHSSIPVFGEFELLVLPNAIATI